MNRGTLIAALIAVLAVGGGWYWYRQHQAPPEEAVEEPPVAEVTPQATGGEAPPDAIQHPIEPSEGADVPALPPVGESDAPLTEDLAHLAGKSTVLTWLVPDAVVRRFVATVDNLPRNYLAERSRVLRGASGPFAVERTTLDAASGEERIVMATSNAARYDAAVAALQALDMQQVAALYRRWYPLFQQAYEDLGYPGRYFNDRVVAVIDHLLETPAPAGPLELVQPKVLYEYADPSVESRSAGQKLLIRMGPEHAAVVKAQLTQLRAAIANDINHKE
ncbi:MAG: DUF3014 domain-containing protein [Steroidobacteraceae bacterium]